MPEELYRLMKTPKADRKKKEVPFSRQAKKAGMSQYAYAKKVLANPHKYSAATRKYAKRIRAKKK